MKKFFKTLLAAYGAKKIGCGCLGTVLIIIAIILVLGNVL